MYHISYPILRDQGAKAVKKLGILNREYRMDHRAYGIPHPGVFLIDTSRVIFAKFAEKDFKERPSIDVIMEAAGKLGKDL